MKYGPTVTKFASELLCYLYRYSDLHLNEGMIFTNIKIQKFCTLENIIISV